MSNTLGDILLSPPRPERTPGTSRENSVTADTTDQFTLNQNEDWLSTSRQSSIGALEMPPQFGTPSGSLSWTPEPASQYWPYLKRKASQELSAFAEEKARFSGLPEADVGEAAQFAHVSFIIHPVSSACWHFSVLSGSETHHDILCSEAADDRVQACTWSCWWALGPTPRPCCKFSLTAIILDWLTFIQDKIRKLTFIVIIDPALPAYLKDNKPGKLVMVCLYLHWTPIYINDTTTECFAEVPWMGIYTSYCWWRCQEGCCRLNGPWISHWSSFGH